MGGGGDRLLYNTQFYPLGKCDISPVGFVPLGSSVKLPALLHVAAV